MTEVAIKIPEELGKFVEGVVKAGPFSDTNDFFVNLLYNVKAQSESELSEEEQAKFGILRDEIAVGVGQADRGDFVDFSADEIIAEGRERRAGGMVS